MLTSELTSKPTPDEKRQLQLLDFTEISRLRNNYANMRLVALGTILTLITGILTFGKDIQDTNVFGIYAVLLLIVFTGIQIISAINRAIYVFIEYLTTIENDFGQTGFSSIWINYEQDHGQDSGSYAFVVATHAINLVITAYVVANLVFKSPNNTLSIIELLLTDTNIASHLSNDITIAIELILIVIAIVLCVYNACHIKNKLNPSGFIDDICDKWEKLK